MANPTRTDVFSPGAQAMPKRGMKLVFCAVGAPKVINPGTLEIAFRGCDLVTPRGSPVYS